MTNLGCNSLVDDVFGKDNQGKVQMEKVMMLIWQFRDDPNVVQFMAQFVAKVRSILLSMLIVVLALLLDSSTVYSKFDTVANEPPCSFGL